MGLFDIPKRPDKSNDLQVAKNLTVKLINQALRLE